MSNQQWNSGQGADWNPQPQEDSNEWSAPQGQEWSQGGQQQGWNQGGNPGAPQDWNQPGQQGSAPEWHQPAQQGPPPGQGWPQQPGGEWQQQAPPQEWGQPQQQQGWQGPGGFQGGATGMQPQQPPRNRDAGPFDFSFKKLTLPGSAGTIFLIGTVGIAVWWLFGFIGIFGVFGGQIDPPLTLIVERLLGGAGLALFAIMMLRAVLEIGVGVAKLAGKDVDEDDKD